MTLRGIRAPARELGRNRVLAAFRIDGAEFGFAAEGWEVSFGVKNLTDERVQVGYTYDFSTP